MNYAPDADGKYRFEWLTGVVSLPVMMPVFENNTLRMVEIYPKKTYANSAEAALDVARLEAESRARRAEVTLTMGIGR